MINPDHESALSEAVRALTPDGSDPFDWLTSIMDERIDLRTELLASQAENAALREALRGMLGVAEHADHHQKTRYSNCHESRVAQGLLAEHEYKQRIAAKPTGEPSEPDYNTIPGDGIAPMGSTGEPGCPRCGRGGWGKSTGDGKLCKACESEAP